MMCKNAAESYLLLLHCLIALSLWQRLFRESNVALDIPVSCKALLYERYKFFQERKRGMV